MKQLGHISHSKGRRGWIKGDREKKIEKTNTPAHAHHHVFFILYNGRGGNRIFPKNNKKGSRY